MIILLPGIQRNDLIFGYILRWLFLIFWGNSMLFSIVAVPVYDPTKSAWRFSFLCILTNVCYFLSIFGNSYSNRYNVISYGGIFGVCISLMISDVEHLSMYLLAICVSSFKNVCLDHLPILKSDVLVFVFALDLYEFFIFFLKIRALQVGLLVKMEM